MTMRCSSTANSITEVLLAGDAVLNLTQQPLNTMPGTMFIVSDGKSLARSKTAARVNWHSQLAFSLTSLTGVDVARLVIVSEEDCSDAEFITRELEARQVPHLHCTLMSACEADAFMDDEDTEAVTERLRQLGYI